MGVCSSKEEPLVGNIRDSGREVGRDDNDRDRATEEMAVGNTVEQPFERTPTVAIIIEEPATGPHAKPTLTDAVSKDTVLKTEEVMWDVEPDSSITTTDFDMRINANRRAHHTDQYKEAVDEKENGAGDDPEVEPKRLIVRRGQQFSFTATLSGPAAKFDWRTVSMSVRLQREGRQSRPGTNTNITGLSLEGAQSVFRWWIRAAPGDKENELIIIVYPAADSCIGKWKIELMQQGVGRMLKQEVFVLFNPWSKHDNVYLENEPVPFPYSWQANNSWRRWTTVKGPDDGAKPTKQGDYKVKFNPTEPIRVPCDDTSGDLKAKSGNGQWLPVGRYKWSDDLTGKFEVKYRGDDYSATYDAVTKEMILGGIGSEREELCQYDAEAGEMVLIDRREEYVLEDRGQVWQGKPSRRGRDWFFGQFEPNVLDVALKSIRELDVSKRGSAVEVTRVVTRLREKECGMGERYASTILAGNWSGPYKYEVTFPYNWAEMGASEEDAWTEVKSPGDKDNMPTEDKQYLVKVMRRGGKKVSWRTWGGGSHKTEFKEGKMVVSTLAENSKRPGEWNGSSEILQQYYETKRTVQFGQCWVFSGVTTAVLRALGIPARSVTNFSSAHDTEGSLTIDKYFDENGDEFDSAQTVYHPYDKLEIYSEENGWFKPTEKDVARGRAEKLNYRYNGIHYPAHRADVDYVDNKNNTIVQLEGNSDMTWNFHVWNEAWMARPFLPRGYGGWQACDATPQEQSADTEGTLIYQCGPAPLRAIKEGDVQLNHDTGFIYAEVNADEIEWKRKVTADGENVWEIMKINKDKVGTNISTMRHDGTRLDVTSLYKYTDGSQAEKMAVFKARKNARLDIFANKMEGGKNPYFEHDRSNEKAEVEMDIKDDVRKTGDDIQIDITFKNVCSEVRNVTYFTQINAEDYRGVRTDVIQEKMKHALTLAAGESATKHITLEAENYVGQIPENGTLVTEVFGKVDESDQLVYDRDVFLPQDADGLTAHIEGAKVEDGQEVPSIKSGEDTTLSISFENQNSIPLTNVRFSVCGTKILGPTPLPDQHEVLQPGETYKSQFTFQAPGRAEGYRSLVVRVFATELAQDIEEVINVQVVEKMQPSEL